jgi:hypothetical protein
VGSELVPSKKEEWGNKNLCRFQKPEPELKEGQLPFAKYGTHIVEGNWCIQDFHVLASEVTPGLQQEKSPMPISFMS